MPHAPEQKAVFFALFAGHMHNTAGDWNRRTRPVQNRRHFADGQVVDDTTGVTEFTDPSDPATALARRTAPEHSRSPRFISLEEREQTRDLAREGCALRTVARLMRREPSTISREIR